MSFCAQCGTRLAAGARFCEECGAAVPAVPAVAGRPMAATAFGEPRQAAGVGGAAQAIQFNPTITVNVAAAAASMAAGGVVVTQDEGVPLVLRAVWFVFVGLWLSLVWLMVAWALNATILGLPLGLAMINSAPQVMTLKSRPRRMRVVTYPGGAVVAMQGVTQVPFPLRALYFLAIGIWLSLMWTLLAWVAAALIITLPLSFWMFDRLPAVTTLRLS